MCDTEADAGAIAGQSGRKPRASARKAEGAVVGQLGKLRPIAKLPTGALARDGGSGSTSMSHTEVAGLARLSQQMGLRLTSVMLHATVLL